MIMKLFSFQGGERYTPLDLTLSQRQRGRAPLDSQILFVLLILHKDKVFFNLLMKRKKKIWGAEKFGLRKVASYVRLRQLREC